MEIRPALGLPLTYARRTLSAARHGDLRVAGMTLDRALHTPLLVVERRRPSGRLMPRKEAVLRPGLEAFEVGASSAQTFA